MGQAIAASGEGAGPENGSSEDRGRRFAAFISYSHADKEAAAKLQRRLERYRLPKHLTIERADGAAAIGRIFRDREDLAAAPSLSDAIRDAIARADALIVVCSPDACASRWVSEEITLFRTLHPDRPILAALVGGDHSTAFPESLTQGGTEPLAADLRKDGDGQTLGFLKIVAGIAGVPLDALVQRDAQRRVRRVTWITAGALAAMLVMGVMTTLAIQARNEAARQRVEAEGLVEYMLTDLREKLKGVGRLDVMGAVNERAMAYYGGDSVKGQVLKARVLHAQGDDELRQGDVASAIQKLRNADSITLSVYSNHQRDPEAVFSHAQSKFWLGYAEEIRGNMPAALQEKSEYARLANEYAALLDRSRQAQKEVGWSHNTLGAAYLKNPETLKTATDHFDKYLDIFAALVASDPKDSEARYSLMDANGWMADAMLAGNKLQEAREYREAQIRQLDILIADDPRNLELKLRRGIALRGLSGVSRKLGKFTDALSQIDKAIDQLHERRGFDHANAEWRRHLILAHIDRGFCGQALGNISVVKSARNAATHLLASEPRSDEKARQVKLVQKLQGY